jgi:hypothetical protein
MYCARWMLGKIRTLNTEGCGTQEHSMTLFQLKLFDTF